jgi:hypothetical protein
MGLAVRQCPGLDPKWPNGSRPTTRAVRNKPRQDGFLEMNRILFLFAVAVACGAAGGIVFFILEPAR